jgi:hypothetical protein
LIVLGVGVVDDVDAELVAGFPNFARDTRVAVGPGVADVTGMIIGDEPSVNYPAKCIGSTMGSDDGKTWKWVGDAVDGVIELY